MAAPLADCFEAELLGLEKKLFAYAMSLVGNIDAAQDLVQETITRALKCREQFRPGSSLAAWTFTIMRNFFLQEARRTNKFPMLQDGDGDYSRNMGDLPRQQARLHLEDLENAMGELTANHREAIWLICVLGLTYDEAAKVIGCPEGSIKSRVNRARSKLAQILNPETDGYGPDPAWLGAT